MIRGLQRPIQCMKFFLGTQKVLKAISAMQCRHECRIEQVIARRDLPPGFGRAPKLASQIAYFGESEL